MVSIEKFLLVYLIASYAVGIASIGLILLGIRHADGKVNSVDYVVGGFLLIFSPIILLLVILVWLFITIKRFKKVNRTY